MEVESGVSYYKEFSLTHSGSRIGTENLEALEGSDLELVQSAFEELKNKLPYNELENLTELEVLQLALEYICGLQRILMEKENQSPKLTV